MSKSIEELRDEMGGKLEAAWRAETADDRAAWVAAATAWWQRLKLPSKAVRHE